MKFVDVWFYDWKQAEHEIERRFGEMLRRGEHVVVWEEESERIFGKSIDRAMQGRCLLEEGTRPTGVTPTIPRHLGLMGYSSRVGSRRGRRYVEIWLPTKPSSFRESPPRRSRTERRTRFPVPSGPLWVSQPKTNRREDLERFYQLLDQLSSGIKGPRLLSECSGTMDWPKRGVYFFFEPGEPREDGETPRVVRVGTHAISQGSSSTLWGRLRSHRGFLTGNHAGGGNHRGSVFRKLVGYSLLEKEERTSYFPTWGKGQSAEITVRDHEHPIEVEVSKHIRGMPFLWLGVDDEPGPASHRKMIERGAIALLSNRNKGEIVDPPSENWLGGWCPREAVHKSGLWNSQHTDEDYDAGFLRVFERYIVGISAVQGRAEAGSPRRTLILIPCSGRKRRGGNPLYERLRGRRMLDVVPENYKDMLRSLRQEVAKAIGESAGPDLGSLRSEGLVAFLPAFKRYDGNLYHAIPERTWQSLGRRAGVDVVIVSGLYGLVFWDEPIRNYNVVMPDSPWPGKRLCTWWSRRGLPKILASLIREIDYSEVHDFLSTHYRTAVSGYQELQPIGRVREHEYPGLGRRADCHRGREIADLLLQLTRTQNQ